MADISAQYALENGFMLQLVSPPRCRRGVSGHALMLFRGNG